MIYSRAFWERRADGAAPRSGAPPRFRGLGKIRHQPGAARQARIGQLPGKFPVHPQGQGIGRQIIVIIRIFAEDPAQLLPVRRLQIPPQAQKRRDRVPPRLATSASE